MILKSFVRMQESSSEEERLALDKLFGTLSQIKAKLRDSDVPNDLRMNLHQSIWSSSRPEMSAQSLKLVESLNNEVAEVSAAIDAILSKKRTMIDAVEKDKKKYEEAYQEQEKRLRVLMMSQHGSPYSTR
jgi:hypothetical protein